MHLALEQNQGLISPTAQPASMAVLFKTLAIAIAISTSHGATCGLGLANLPRNALVLCEDDHFLGRVRLLDSKLLTPFTTTDASSPGAKPSSDGVSFLVDLGLCQQWNVPCERILHH
jgi:hypothetical protein